MSTLFALKEKLANVGEELAKVSAELVDKAANAAIPIEEVKELQGKKDSLQTRFDLIKEQHDKLEAEQKAKLRQDKITAAPTGEARLIAAKAEFIRAKILGRDMSPEAKEVLANTAPLRALPADGNTGQHLLPTTQGKEVIVEPFVRNPLRGKI
ncbi:MAG: phage major capsid protein, partial [Bacillota bacterium]|nr:phage major capsid protein [Bacillota bacterium]